MKIKFDSRQQYQIDAVNSIVDIFDGQPLHQGDFEFRLETAYDGVLSGQVQTELGMGNSLLLNDETILKNVQEIQDENDIDRIPELQGYHFSVEMETGTGKTYVYLRTIFELSQKYGFKKYVIVVEGIIDAMILWIYGLNSVCCFGSVISEDQFALLSIFDEIIICLDNDAAGIKGWLKVKKKINESMLAGSLISRIVMPRNIDVNLLNSKKKFKKLFRNRKFYTDSYKTENRN